MPYSSSRLVTLALTCPLPPGERDKKVALSRKGKEGSAVPRCESLSLLSSPSTGEFLPFPLSLDGRGLR